MAAKKHNSTPDRPTAKKLNAVRAAGRQAAIYLLEAKWAMSVGWMMITDELHLTTLTESGATSTKTGAVLIVDAYVGHRRVRETRAEAGNHATYVEKNLSR